MNKFAVGVLFAATLASPLLAHAQVHAEASLTNFSYTLIDLLPDDGITPSLSIVAPVGYAGGSSVYGSIMQRRTNEPEFEDSRTQITTRYNRNLDVKLGAPAGAANASVTGSNFGALQFHTNVSTTGAPEAFRSASTYARSEILEFVLSPGTQVSFFADFNGSATTTEPKGSAYRDLANAEASFMLRSDGFGYDSTSINLAASNLSFADAPPATMSASERMSLTLGNSSASAAKLHLEIFTGSSLQSAYDAQAASAVPEPATTAMLAAGLALVAGAVRRRKAQDQ
ncbi:PEP-CTERM sorting domain-containing protein [Massilia atriviolacea]|nr:PEP-CTERM sorting domain-containing protein [Massilia atriviolacea]